MPQKVYINAEQNVLEHTLRHLARMTRYLTSEEITSGMGYNLIKDDLRLVRNRLNKLHHFEWAIKRRTEIQVQKGNIEYTRVGWEWAITQKGMGYLKWIDNGGRKKQYRGCREEAAAPFKFKSRESMLAKKERQADDVITISKSLYRKLKNLERAGNIIAVESDAYQQEKRAGHGVRSAMRRMESLPDVETGPSAPVETVYIEEERPIKPIAPIKPISPARILTEEERLERSRIVRERLADLKKQRLLGQ